MLVGQEITVMGAIIISLVGITVVMLELGLLSLFVRILSRVAGNVKQEKKVDTKKEIKQETNNVVKTDVVPNASVQTQVIDNDDEISAVMCAVLEEIGCNENEVVFKSITKI